MMLAHEFRRPDWRRMLSEISSSEYQQWTEYFRENSFSNVLLDAEFSTLKSLMVMLVTGKKKEVEDFCLLTPFAQPEVKSENTLTEAGAGILGGIRFEPENR